MTHDTVGRAKRAANKACTATIDCALDLGFGNHNDEVAGGPARVPGSSHISHQRLERHLVAERVLATLPPIAPLPLTMKPDRHRSIAALLDAAQETR